MKRYTMEDRSGPLVRKVERLSLVQVYEMTDWTEMEFDDVSEMKINDARLFDSGVYVERTS